MICHTFRPYCIFVHGDTFTHSFLYSTSCSCCLLQMYSCTGHISLPARSVDALGSTAQYALFLLQSTVSSSEILPHNHPRHNRNVYSGACLCRHGKPPVLDFAPHCQFPREDHDGQNRAMAFANQKPGRGFSLESDSFGSNVCRRRSIDTVVHLNFSVLHFLVRSRRIPSSRVL